MDKIITKIKNSPIEGKLEAIIVSFLILLGLSLRLFWILEVKNEPISDYKTYYDIAVSIVNGDVHPMFGYQGPGYPLLLSLIFYLFDSTSIYIAKILNVILSTFTLLFIYLISKKLFKNNYMAIIVLFLITILPNYIAYNNVLGTETFFLFIFSLILLVFLKEFNFKIKYPLLGILIGIATLTKPQFLVYPIILAIIYYLKKRSIRKTLLSFSVIYLFTAIIIIPMTIINYIKHEEIIPVSYNGGYVLYINNNSQNTNGMYMDVTSVEPSQDLLQKLDEKGIAYGDLNSKVSSLYQDAAINWIVEHPVTFIKLGLLRVKATFFSGASDIQTWSMSSYIKELEMQMSWNDYARNIYTFTFLSDIFVFVITIFGMTFTLVGSIYLISKIKKTSIPYIISIPTLNVLFFMLISFFFEGQSRYNYPVLFLFTICFVFILYKLFSNLYKSNLEEHY